MQEANCLRCKHYLELTREGLAKSVDAREYSDCIIYGIGLKGRAKTCKDYQDRTQNKKGNKTTLSMLGDILSFPVHIVFAGLFIVVAGFILFFIGNVFGLLVTAIIPAAIVGWILNVIVPADDAISIRIKLSIVVAVLVISLTVLVFILINGGFNQAVDYVHQTTMRAYP